MRMRGDDVQDAVDCVVLRAGGQPSSPMRSCMMRATYQHPTESFVIIVAVMTRRDALQAFGAAEDPCPSHREPRLKRLELPDQVPVLLLCVHGRGDGPRRGNGLTTAEELFFRGPKRGVRAVVMPDRHERGAAGQRELRKS